MQSVPIVTGKRKCESHRTKTAHLRPIISLQEGHKKVRKGGPFQGHIRWEVGTRMALISNYYLEDGGSRFLQNTGTYLSNYMVSHHQRHNFHQLQVLETKCSGKYLYLRTMT